MIQLLPCVVPLVHFGADNHAFPVLSDPVYSVFGTQSLHGIPLPWAATFRNLILISNQSGHTTTTLRLMKDAADTALAVQLPDTSDGPFKNLTDSVTFAAGEDCWWKFAGTGGPGYTFGVCVEVGSQGQVFGLPSTFGAVGGAGPVAVGGALGNGYLQPYTTSYSTSRSICAIAGSMTHMAVRTHDTPPGVGDGWYAVIRLNLVEQDGTGGTVDTRCTIVGDGVTDRAFATFDLPLVPGDVVEVVYYRTGGSHPFSLNGHLAVGLGFVPTTDGEYMLTGGSNNALGTTPGICFSWTRPDQSHTGTESLCQAPIGPAGLRVTGGYIESDAPGTDPDDQTTWTLRRSGADTAVRIVLQHLTSSGSVGGLGGTVVFLEDHLINWKGLATGGSSPSMSRLYWSLAVSPRPAPVIGPYLWVEQTRVAQ